MDKSISYNGKSRKRSLYKIKKHLGILNKRRTFRKQQREINSIDNRILNLVFKSILAVRDAKYSVTDKAIFERMDSFRAALLSDTSEVSYETFGSSAIKQVKDICHVSASPKVWGHFLYFLAKNTQAKNVLEIGTNVGVSGLHLLSGMKQNTNNFKLTTMEGLNQLCSLSEKQFLQIVEKDKFEIIAGLFDTTFSELINQKPVFDLLFVDGNHQKAPTLTYFEQLKSCIVGEAVFVFDDIYYNTEMTEAWNIIKRDEQVNFSIDLYKLGIVIINSSGTVRNKSFGLHMSYD